MRTEVDDYKDIKDSLNRAHSNIADVQTDVTLLGDKLKENESNYIGLQQKLSETTEENRILKEKLLHLDWYTRRENLKFKGILEDENESSLITQRKIRDLIINKLKLDAGKNMIFQRCHRLRKTTSANADIIGRFSWYGDRESVWNNRSMLKGSDIYINEDFPEEMEKRRTRLYPILKAARSKKMKATLNKDKLIVEGKTYQLETLDSLPEEIQPKTLATRETEHLVLFYGQDSCYSSFYPSQFMIDGTNFVCSEQYYQYNKALRLGNNDIAEQIMKTDKAAEHHRLGKKLRVDGTI